MGKRKQLELPEVENIKRIKREPQPHLGKFATPKKFEILYHPFNLRFKGKIRRWLERLDSSEETKLTSFLGDDEIRIVALYFFPQGKDNAWLTQDELLTQSDFTSKKKLRKKLKNILVKIWDKAKKARNN